MMKDEFLIAVLTLPGSFAGEVECLEALLEAGVERLHLRKPEMAPLDLERLVERLASKWAARLVLHYQPDIARRFGVARVHGPLGMPLLTSTSVHSWEEFQVLPAGLEYAFISPLFDSISKKGYQAHGGLLTIPERPLPCRPMGLGGVGGATIGEMVRRGWTGAAVLGWIWDEPGKAVERFEQLKRAMHEPTDRIGGSGI